MELTELEKEARAIVGKPDWYPWIFEAISNGVLCTGACCPLITRGKNKGRPNYRKADPATKQTVVLVRKDGNPAKEI